MNLCEGRGVFGEFSIFGTLPGIFAGQFPVPEGTGKEWMDEESYLQKGEKILSLLRKKKPKSFSKDNVLEIVKKNCELTRNAAERKIGTELENEIISMLDTQNGGEAFRASLDDACKMLSERFPEYVEVKAESRIMQYRLADELCRGKQNCVLNILYCETDAVVPVGAVFPKKYEKYGARFKWETEVVKTKTFKRLASELVLRKYVLEKLQSLRSGGWESYSQHRAVGRLLERARDVSFEELKNCMVNGRTTEIYSLLLRYPETEDAQAAVLLLDFYEIYRILESFKRDYDMEKEASKMDKELSREHAKSFQTKRNIPYKTVRAMSRSDFNDYFGYVEFDEECDHSLMRELCMEYKAFCNALGIGKYPEVSLRFRKLGNHKASGLYYPSLKCLCVDVRSPESMAHEVGHMLDYHFGSLSTKYSFQKIYDKYENLLKDYQQKSSEEEQKVLKGSSKYNLKYYLQPTEVFARCFEMYVVRTRNIDNSLCRPGGFAYPEDETLLALIGEYFNELFSVEEKREDEIA